MLTTKNNKQKSELNLSITADLNQYIENEQQGILNEIFNHFSKRFRYFDEEDERFIYNPKTFEAFEKQYKERHAKNTNLIINVTFIQDGGKPYWVLHR